MALNDWKKILTAKSSNTWMNKKTKTLIKVDKTADKDWIVFCDRFLFPTKYFKSKYQALKFAKLKMVNH